MAANENIYSVQLNGNDFHNIAIGHVDHVETCKFHVLFLDFSYLLKKPLTDESKILIDETDVKLITIVKYVI